MGNDKDLGARHSDEQGYLMRLGCRQKWLRA